MVQIGTFDWCPAENDALWSDNLFRLHGVSPGATTPSLKWVLERVHPADRPQLELTAASIARGKPPPSLTYRFTLPDGRVRHLRGALACVEQSVRRSTCISGVVQDITEQVSAEHELKAYEAVISTLAEWGSFEAGAQRLLAHLGLALHFDLGVLWVPEDGVLVPTAVWHDCTIAEDIASSIANLRLNRGEGLAGHVWQSREAENAVNILDDPRFEPSYPLVEAGLFYAVAAPVLTAQKVLAVICLGAREPTALSDRMTRALARIGSQIATFTSRRNQQLAPPALTRREREILQLVADGQSVAEIADHLNVGRSTIKKHLENTYRKLGVRDRTAAVAQMMRTGLID